MDKTGGSNQRGPLWAIQEILAPVLGALLSHDEVDSIHITRSDSGQLTLHLSACGEPSSFYLWAPDWSRESDAEVRRRLASELQDFIAESTFAWGERRTYEEI